ncbi:dUTP diphosphatase [Clostridium omnivorum]|uniref:dUTP diphosphatase n=1 Tax=Clostridium omnivorum TaxID=1604902 RepID=A0ABQ5NCA8_9CLOT|nr:dUTP diphosphatase [Clostridium sp. E14]GLC32895.1 deoxyuridine 5'-triphosphate nucleotidohydrolase [Clostridium sp. E14]
MKVKLIDKNCILTKGHITDAGWDLKTRESKVLEPLEVYTLPVGVCVQLPKGFSGDVRPRSGLNSKGIVVLYGTADFGYTGEIKVTLINLSGKPYQINQYDRIAQLVINKIDNDANLEIVEELSCSSRGANGFGSTGR